MTTEQTARFLVGDRVKKVGGDYTFVGVVVARFKKLSGLIRYVVEDDRGVLHVYNDRNLTWQVVGADYSAIEARVAAHMTEPMPAGVQNDQWLDEHHTPTGRLKT